MMVCHQCLHNEKRGENSVTFWFAPWLAWTGLSGVEETLLSHIEIRWNQHLTELTGDKLKYITDGMILLQFIKTQCG